MCFDDRLQESHIVGQLNKRDRPSERRTIVVVQAGNDRRRELMVV
jgi:hypothetical protein